MKKHNAYAEFLSRIQRIPCDLFAPLVLIL